MLNPSISTTMRLQFGELNITPRVASRLHELDFTVPELEDAINDHKSPCDGEPSVYCGTYGKYNDGSLCGLWIDLSSFDDYDEGFPRQWYGESGFDEDDFDHIKEYCELCDKYDQDAVDDYMEFHDELDSFEEAYCGNWDCEEDFARHIVEECYDLDRIMGNLSNYFDYEAFGRDLFMYDYSMGANNNVFRVV